MVYICRMISLFCMYPFLVQRGYGMSVKELFVFSLG